MGHINRVTSKTDEFSNIEGDSIEQIEHRINQIPYDDQENEFDFELIDDVTWSVKYIEGFEKKFSVFLEHLM